MTAVEPLADYQWQIFLNTPFLSIPSGIERESRLQGVFFARGVEGQILALTKSYPELARIWLVQIENWRRFFQTFSRDATRFVWGRKWDGRIGIDRLKPDLSDFHDGNAAVVHVRFSNGVGWFYKPRSAPQSVAWFELLSRINRAGFSHPFKIPRFVSGKDHHWMEAIPERRCVSHRQQREFWFRMGVLLYLLDLLQGVDFHTGNLICSGAQPVFVDCETLLHPETPMPRGIAARERGLFRIGMLPLEGRPGSNVAALGPMTFARVSIESRRLSHELIRVTVVEGFRAMDEFFKGEPRHLSALHDATAQLRASGCRIIYRPTGGYHSILRRSLSSDMLTDTAKRSAFIRQACQTLSAPKRVAAKEAHALKDLDIPLLTGRCSKALDLRSNRAMGRAMQQIVQALAKCQAAANSPVPA